MDGKPVQIITIENTNKNCRQFYKLQTHELHDILEPIGDKEIAIVSIAGPSRRGKSFIFSLFLKYLSEYNNDNIDWINVRGDEPLKGFQWKSGYEPETQGIWVWSKPIVITQSSGKELAIILMDTQGVYDSFTDQRDWSTIVGLSLLTSSLFIFNFFNDIQEDTLTNLETFSSYAKEAAKEIGNNSHVFQKLLLLVRDWSHATQFKYGHKGGLDYASKYLSVRHNQPEASQRTRNFMRQSFEEIDCFLMPEPMVDKEDEHFDGSVQKLNHRFTDKVNELFLKSLNPDSMKPKVINGSNVIARDLISFFRQYVEQFNGDRLPTPLDLVQATAKATDYNLVHKLKDEYVMKIHQRLDSKAFLTNQELQSLHDHLLQELKEAYIRMKTTKSRDLEIEIIKMLENELNIVYRKVFEENGNKKQIAANVSIEKKITFYNTEVNRLLESYFVKQIEFEEFSSNMKKKFINDFKEEFNGEDRTFFDHNILKFIELFDDSVNSQRQRNIDLRNEIKENNKKAIEESLDYYSKEMQTKVDENKYLTTDVINQYDLILKSKAVNIFSEKYKGNQFNKMQEEINKSLNETKVKFQTYYSNKIKAITASTEKEMTNALNFYKKNMIKVAETLCGKTFLTKYHSELEQKTLEEFERKCVLRDKSFLKSYSIKLENDIEDSFALISKDFDERLESFNQTIKQNINKYADNCQTDLMNIISDAESTRLRFDELKKQMIGEISQKYENIPKNDKLNEVNDVIITRIYFEFNKLLAEKLIDNYNQEMEQNFANNHYLSENRFKEIHNNTKTHCLKTFKDNKKPLSDKEINEISAKLANCIQTDFIEFKNRNQSNRQNIFETLSSDCNDLYQQNMTKCLNQSCLESEQFDRISYDNKNVCLAQFVKILPEEDEPQYFSTFKQMLDKSENSLRNENNRLVKESTDRNSVIVSDSLIFYESKMQSILDEKSFLSMELFDKNEQLIRDETLHKFNKEPKLGGIEFIYKFGSDLNKKLKISKKHLRNNFQQTLESIESEVKKKFDSALNSYEELILIMYMNIENIKKFQESNAMIRIKSLNQFKNSCQIKDDIYMTAQITSLEQKMDESFAQKFKLLENSIKKSGDYFKRITDEVFAEYLNVMNELFKDGCLVPDDDLYNLHTDLKSSALSNFDLKFEDNNDEESIVKSRNLLNSKIDNEFEKIKNNNKSKLEEIEKQKLRLKAEISDFVDIYEEKMNEIIDNINSEDQLNNQHKLISDEVINKFKQMNPFSDNQTFEPFLIQLEVEINKALVDMTKILNVNLLNNNLELQNVERDARVFYREEMKKFYKKNNFLSVELLEQCNRRVLKQTIEKFRTQVKMSEEIFKELILKSLIDIYKDIWEENAKNTPKDPAIGIDLGTTNSCVAFFQPSKPNGNVIIIPNDLGKNTTPSVIRFNEDNEEVVVGQTAKDEAYSKPRNTIFSAKRLIGRNFSDETVQKDIHLWPFRVIDGGSDVSKIRVNTNNEEKDFFPEQISAKVLKNLKECAEKHLNCDVKSAVITVPAYFNDAQKEATRDAGAIAGLNVLKIINEPTAAAIAFKLDKSDEIKERNVLIYDFGGGTFDVAALTIDRKNIEIKAVGGDNHLGGDDIDHNLVEYCLSEFCLQNNMVFEKNTEEGEKALRRLTTNCEKHKWQLSACNEVNITVDNFYNRIDLSVVMTRSKFEELNLSIFERSMDSVEQVLIDANLTREQIDDIVLVGGTSRIPKIQEMLSDLFNGKALNHSVNPDEAVAVGAAIQAAILNGATDREWDHLIVTDVAPMSLGVKVKGGFMAVMVKRNTKVPVTFMKTFQTTVRNQNEVDIEVYEGEEPMVADNKLLGTFKVSNIPKGKAGEQQIDVTFDINDEGILHVSAVVVSNGEENSIDITEHKGRLTDEQRRELTEQEM